MTSQWFDQARLDLGGLSTEAAVQQALQLFADIAMTPTAGDAEAEIKAMRGHAIEAAGYALDHLIADPAFCVVAKAAGLDPSGLQSSFKVGQFDAVAADLDIIISVGRTADLPKAENLVRETIDGQAELDADLGQEFQNFI